MLAVLLGLLFGAAGVVAVCGLAKLYLETMRYFDPEPDPDEF